MIGSTEQMLPIAGGMNFGSTVFSGAPLNPFLMVGMPYMPPSLVGMKQRASSSSSSTSSSSKSSSTSAGKKTKKQKRKERRTKNKKSSHADKKKRSRSRSCRRSNASRRGNKKKKEKTRRSRSRRRSKPPRKTRNRSRSHSRSKRSRSRKKGKSPYKKKKTQRSQKSPSKDRKRKGSGFRSKTRKRIKALSFSCSSCSKHSDPTNNEHKGGECDKLESTFHSQAMPELVGMVESVGNKTQKNESRLALKSESASENITQRDTVGESQVRLEDNNVNEDWDEHFACVVDPSATTRQEPIDTMSTQPESDATRTFSNWLRNLDGGEGTMLEYLEALQKEFESLDQLAASVALVPEGTKVHGCLCLGVVDSVDPIVYDVLNMSSMAHKLLLARGLVALVEGEARTTVFCSRGDAPFHDGDSGTEEPTLHIEESKVRDKKIQAVLRLKLNGRERLVRGRLRASEEEAIKDGEEMKHAFMTEGLTGLREVQQKQRSNQT